MMNPYSVLNKSKNSDETDKPQNESVQFCL